MKMRGKVFQAKKAGGKGLKEYMAHGFSRFRRASAPRAVMGGTGEERMRRKCHSPGEKQPGQDRTTECEAASPASLPDRPLLQGLVSDAREDS